MKERKRALSIIIYYEILINSITSIKVQLRTSRKFLSEINHDLTKVIEKG